MKNNEIYHEKFALIHYKNINFLTKNKLLIYII